MFDDVFRQVYSAHEVVVVAEQRWRDKKGDGLARLNCLKPSLEQYQALIDRYIAAHRVIVLEVPVDAVDNVSHLV